MPFATDVTGAQSVTLNVTSFSWNETSFAAES